MAAIDAYTPDACRLAAALPVIYAGHPAGDGLDAARRIAATAGELLAAVPGDGVEPSVVNAAGLFLLAGPADVVGRADLSGAIAGAWLLGAGAPGGFVTGVSSVIADAWREFEDVGVAADTALGQAALLDLACWERHAAVLGGAPAVGREREQYLSRYRRWILIPALLLEGRLASAEAAWEMYRARMGRLAAYLDGLDGGLVPADWRRLAEVDIVERGVARLLAGEDPALVKSEMPVPGLPYAEYRGQQRGVIAGSHDRILELTHDRIEASRNVAAEKYLESDTIHKPAVEENLFVSARRRARRLGLSAETAEDIARLLLSNARAVQERTLNDIAQRLSRLHGQILDADSPETRTEEADMAIPSLVVRTGDQPLARENELIKELRVTGLNEAYPEQRRQFVNWFDAPHPYMETGQLVGSRDADLFLQALTDGQRCKVMAAMSTDGPMHLGNGALVNLLRYFQALGAEIVIGFRDESDDRNRARKMMLERLLTMAAAGLDLHKTDAYLQPDRSAIVETAFALGQAIPLSVLNSALGLRLNSSVTDTFRPLLRLADILHQQQAEYGGPGRTLVVDGIGGDVYVRMARNVAEGFGFVKPSALYLRMVRSLTTYEDPGTGSAVEVMTNAVPQGRVAYDDGPEEIRRRIGRAYTGGRRTLAEQRAQGGNPDPRVCAVASLHAFYATPDADGYANLQRRCRSGGLLCGDCKAMATDGLLEYLAGHRQARGNLPDDVIRRGQALAGCSGSEEQSE